MLSVGIALHPGIVRSNYVVVAMTLPGLLVAKCLVLSYIIRRKYVVYCCDGLSCSQPFVVRTFVIFSVIFRFAFEGHPETGS